MKIYYSNVGGIEGKDKIYFPFDFKIGILISYFNLKKIKRPSFCDSLFLDSGAFSAWTQKKEIDVYKYIKFIKEQKNLQVYASLDSIECYKTSLKNYKIMLKKGLSPLPTYHYGEPLHVLDTYIKHTDYIALGGIAKKRMKHRLPWLDNIFDKYPQIKFHGFGIQEKQIMERYPWKSTDGTFAHYAARLGGIRTPYGAFVISIAGKDKYKMELKQTKTPLIKKKIIDWIEEEAGINYKKACESTVEGTMFRAFINIYYLETCTRNQTKQFKSKIKGFGL